MVKYSNEIPEGDLRPSADTRNVFDFSLLRDPWFTRMRTRLLCRFAIPLNF